MSNSILNTKTVSQNNIQCCHITVNIQLCFFSAIWTDKPHTSLYTLRNFSIIICCTSLNQTLPILNFVSFEKSNRLGKTKTAWHLKDCYFKFFLWHCTFLAGSKLIFFLVASRVLCFVTKESASNTLMFSYHWTVLTQSQGHLCFSCGFCPRR